MIPHLLIKWLIHRLFRRFFGEISFNCKICFTVRFLMKKLMGFSQGHIVNESTYAIYNNSSFVGGTPTLNL